MALFILDMYIHLYRHTHTLVVIVPMHVLLYIADSLHARDCITRMIELFLLG